MDISYAPPEPYRSADYAVPAAPATRIAADGDIVDLGDRHFEVIHTPGHSPGGIALWEADTEILFSGDIVYDGPLIEDACHSDSRDHHASMKRLHDLPVPGLLRQTVASHGCSARGRPGGR